MKAAWPYSYFTPLTLGDVKTAAWLMGMRMIIFTTDLDLESVKSDVETIKAAAFDVYTSTDEEIIWGSKQLLF